MQRTNSRAARGQGIVALVLLIAVFIILPIGCYAFELGKVQLTRMELRTATDAAGLAAAASLAGQDTYDQNTAHQNARDCALTAFRRNQILGTALSSADLTYDSLVKPDAEECFLMIEFIDPLTGNVVPMGDSKGKCVRATATYGLNPSFGKFIGISSIPLRATSSGGVPELDMVVCFDLSGSMDDQTPVTFVRRQWQGDLVTGRIQHTITSAAPGSTAGAAANGTIYDIIGPPPSGTRVNGIAPQNVSTSNQSDVRWPLTFSEMSGVAVGLRGLNNTGSPPGNLPPSSISLGNNYTYTDVVTNIDGKTVFGGCSYNGYDFPNLPTLVEASRGNLENATVFAQSRANTVVSVIPRPGYREAYLQAAQEKLQPIATARDATGEFFTLMNTNTRAHFGFVAFSDRAGTSESDYISAYNVDQHYANAGQANFPLPNIALNAAANQTKYTEIQAKLPSLVATSSTNIGDALHQAVQQLRFNSRPSAKKAIVLFTDGQPTTGGPLSSDPWTNARQAAVEARNAGIPIYTIGLAQNSEIVTSEVSILNDTNSSTSSGGVAAIAGNGGQFFLVTRIEDLQKSFRHVARCLVQLVHS